MAKRKRSASASEFEGSDISFDEAPKKKPKVPKKATKKAAKKDDLVSATPHDKSLHVIETAEDICDALLKWYSSAYTARAMPWRKPYNPNLTKQERAQRAYEVRDYTAFPTAASYSLTVGMGLGNNASADTGSYCHPVL